MDRENAIKYLKRKDIRPTEEKIEDVMKEGKIYGDPVAEIQW